MTTFQEVIREYWALTMDQLLFLASHAKKVVTVRKRKWQVQGNGFICNEIAWRDFLAGRQISLHVSRFPCKMRRGRQMNPSQRSVLHSMPDLTEADQRRAVPDVIQALPLPEPESRLGPMTVVIGLICEDGKAAVMAADRTIYMSAPTHLLIEGSERKIFPLTEYSLVGTSGLIHDPVIYETKKKYGNLESLPMQEIADKIREMREEFRDAQYEKQVTRRLFGLSASQFKEKVVSGTSPTVLVRFEYFASQFSLGLDFLLVGADRDEMHGYVIDDAGLARCWNDLGFATIGSGWTLANVSLGHRGHTKSSKLSDAVFSAFEAKKAAERAFGVGKFTDLAVLQLGVKPEFLTPDSIAGLEQIYQERQPQPLSSVAHDRIRAMYSGQSQA